MEFQYYLIAVGAMFVVYSFFTLEQETKVKEKKASSSGAHGVLFQIQKIAICPAFLNS
jgi:hypothetical protein